MSVLSLLYKLKETERQAGDLYRLIQQTMAVRDPATADLFKRMQSDERIHEKQVEMALSIYKEAPEQFAPQPDAIFLIDKVLQKIQEVSAHVERHRQTIMAAELISLALEIEVDMEERHQSFYIKVKDTQLGALFKNILDADTEHVTLLKSQLS